MTDLYTAPSDLPARWHLVVALRPRKKRTEFNRIDALLNRWLTKKQYRVFRVSDSRTRLYCSDVIVGVDDAIFNELVTACSDSFRIYREPVECSAHSSSGEKWRPL